MDKLNKRLNLVINLAIVVVLVLIGIVFAKNLLSARSTHQNRDYRVPAGSKLTLPGVDWASNEQTLLLVLEKKCHYCKESAPFYQQLAREAGQTRSVRLIAVLPQDIAEAKDYLSSLNVPIDEVRQSSLEALGVKGTPTLILLNRNGEVMQSWPGKLPPEQEREVLKRIMDQNDSDR